MRRGYFQSLHGDGLTAPSPRFTARGIYTLDARTPGGCALFLIIHHHPRIILLRLLRVGPMLLPGRGKPRQYVRAFRGDRQFHYLHDIEPQRAAHDAANFDALVH